MSLAATVTTAHVWLLALCVFSIALIYIGTRESSKDAGNRSSLRLYIVLAAAVVLTRLGFRLIFGSVTQNQTTLFNLPRLQLNLWFGAPLEFLGPVSLESLSQGITDGLRLAAIILGIGLATVLADPRRLLKSMPAALFEIATSIAIAINLAPQMIRSIQRVRKGRLLRGRSKGVGALAGIIIPVLEDTIHSSLALAASMDSRGFGTSPKTKSRLLTGAISMASITLMAVGSYLLITQGTQNAYLLIIALGLAVLTLVIGSRSSNRTKLVSNTFYIWDLAPLLTATVILISAYLPRWLP